ncbi:copper resistance protein NlpE [Lutibacter sp. A64]|uniref:copper resistance protein NlpE n=1 Tax=Lutibacter sp. A64 TaxID=2918526 RepID=UPI001F06949C|nr:copper resistance protein NlpE [Lutibacter sp. A64]UMB53028.1 copper resistance protein NlpE [Lutibacter sp. A64]
MIKNNLIIICLGVLLLISCKEHKKIESNTIKKTAIESPISKENESIFGTYIGEIPCADCDGITKKLTLKKDNTFSIESIYKGKGDDQSFTEEGTFKVDNKHIILSIKNAPSMYKIGTCFVEQLDMDGKQIQSSLNYKLMKVNY